MLSLWGAISRELTLWAGERARHTSEHASKRFAACPGERVNWRSLAWFAATVLLSPVLAGVWTIATAGERFEGQAEIVDANTFRVSRTKLRLWGVDAPESGQVSLNAAGNRYLCGSKAALALADWIGRRRLSCQQRDTDRYGRPVASCTLAGEDVAGWLARQGWARDYPRYSRGAYAHQEQHARDARRGIWQGEHVAPWDWRRGARLAAEADGASALGCRIKGNVTSSGRIYHVPGSRHYGRTRIDERAGERWFLLRRGDQTGRMASAAIVML
jgi:endonuclease YncB( thermonuclease family)